MTSPDIIQSLRKLVSCYALRQLDSVLDEFNIFDAVGLTHQEIRHSTFLAFLLSPHGSHGLRDEMLKAMLRLAGYDADRCESMDLSDVEVRRESFNIDVLAFSRSNRIVLLIENKVFTGEHSDQLKRYYETVQSTFGGYDVMAVYLTRDGGPASLPAYRPISYSQLCETVERVMTNATVSVRPIVRDTVNHYIRAVRKHILEDAEVKALCKEIYAEHRSAIEAIISHIPPREAQLLERAKSLILETNGLVVCAEWARKHNSTKTYGWCIGFVPESWRQLHEKGVLEYTQPDSWVQSGMVLYCQIWVEPRRVRFQVIVRNAMPEQMLRIKQITLSHAPPWFWDQASKDIAFLFQSTVISEDQSARESLDEQLARIDDWWARFVENDLRVIENIFVQGLGTEAD